MSFSDTLKQKAGPLPVWAWGAILGVLIVGGMYWFSSRNTAATESTGETVAYPDLDGNSGTGSSGVSTVTNGSGGSSAPEFTSSLAWMTYAIARLTAEGYSPLTVQAALSKYLAGEALTAEEGRIVNLVISRYGMPPNGTTGISPVADDPKPYTPVSVPIVAPVIQGVTKTVKSAAEIAANLANTAPIYAGNNQVSFQGVLYTQPVGGYTTTDSITGAMRIHNANGSIAQIVPVKGAGSVSTPVTSSPVPTGGSSGAAPVIERGTRTGAATTMPLGSKVYF